MDHDRQSGEVCNIKINEYCHNYKYLIGNWTTGVYFNKNEIGETIP